MKKVGIYTLNGHCNFGNRLQNYALEQTLKKLNVKPITIWDIEKKYLMKERLKNILLPFVKNPRERLFRRFSKNYLNIKYIINLENCEKMMDYYIVGSDQVWNFEFEEFNYKYFLSFGKKENNISYAASFGVSDIEDKSVDNIKRGLNNIKYISVREDAGKKIVEKLTKRDDIEVLIDPTMLLTSKEWNIVSRKPKQFNNKKYILNYFLGDMPIKRKSQIEKFAKKYNCEIINIMDDTDKFFNIGPSEFLYLEEHAFLICTDSFHACVFAILYNKPFLVFEREDKRQSMNSRIKTLLDKFELEDRRYKGEISDKDLQCNYSHAFEILEQERKKSNDFLKKALDIKRG